MTRRGLSRCLLYLIALLFRVSRVLRYIWVYFPFTMESITFSITWSSVFFLFPASAPASSQPLQCIQLRPSICSEPQIHLPQRMPKRRRLLTSSWHSGEKSTVLSVSRRGTTSHSVSAIHWSLPHPANFPSHHLRRRNDGLHFGASLLPQRRRHRQKQLRQ